LRMTAGYTSERKQFGKAIATFQAVAQRAADAYIDVEAIRLATWQAVWRLATGRPASRELARLHRLVTILDWRRNQLFAPVSLLLLWGTQAAFALEAWRARCGHHLEGWLDALDHGGLEHCFQIVTPMVVGETWLAKNEHNRDAMLRAFVRRNDHAGLRHLMADSTLPGGDLTPAQLASLTQPTLASYVREHRLKVVNVETIRLQSLICCAVWHMGDAAEAAPATAAAGRRRS